ncbi:MAG: DMT family transporter [Clostridiales bacterium]|nr:DMT family transporter [Clostridiales bacterium]
MRRLKGETYLLLAAFVWGTAFIFQKMGMDHIGPLAFGFFRFTIGALALIPVFLIFDKVKRKKVPEGVKTPTTMDEFKDKNLLKGGALTGIVCFAAVTFQQIGIVYTTAGKAGFITALYIILVPIILMFFKQRTSLFAWIGVVIGSFGLYLLCITEGFTIAIGDGLVMACAIFYALQIIFVDMYADKVDPVKLAFIEFMITGILSGIGMLIFEDIDMQGVIDCTVPILYTAILEVSVAFTLEIFGQKYTPPTIAAILMSFESVFAAISGTLFLHEVMTQREIMGCVLLFIAVIVSQLPLGKKEEIDCDN